MAQKRIVLAGGTGNIGKLLTLILIHLDYQVIIFSRRELKSSHPNIRYIKWDGESLGNWVQEMEGIDTLINLSGKSIQCRFTDDNKKILLESRIEPTRILGEAISTLSSPPRLWINFSGISLFEGVEGLNNEESTSFGNTFLAHLTQEWEKTFVEANTPATKKVILRLSPVLSTKFGMFKELLPLAKLGLGGKVGDGNQQIAWIHELDLVRLVMWIINLESPSALYHACAPEPESNKEFMKNLRKAAGMPIGMPLPALFAKLGAYFKGVESDMLLLTNAVSTTRTLQEGFIFNYPNTQKAFEHLTKK
ncbi:TIGR01777 family oxidoreductase [Sphingobacterium sp. SGL-16]|uniref:TIGR01777 family oxidoreductase n=1 Tax=Sphingobacterium sp. SGL-16 TaxID=2710883 RepID=UPI0013EA0CBB|nr:TIGR01777 family oxidoreductase [Sphingobacterium sp. SGL-16]NGM72710.1 TIGR01777 family protein [Sphingobacterium sp. SGL-16]